MKIASVSVRTLAWLLIVLLTAPPGVIAQQQPASQQVFKPEELEQILATIALYPDPLVSQILMASTYPLEVALAERWVKQNASLKGDAVTAALEKQDWDPSVKSLVAFPQVLTMMSEKLDWTQKLGDAFLADQKKVLDTIQSLRAKAQASGNLKTTKEQTVIVEEKIIKIEPANPQVIYVPSYNPTVVYGAWPYPAYPPYAYYPPGYVASSMMWFGAGMAMGAAFSGAWGYGWGNCDYNGGKVNIDNSRNVNFSGNNIDRGKYANQLPAGGKGDFRHNPEHRKGVSYRDQGTAQNFNRASTNDSIKSREQFRGRAEQGRQEIGRGGVSDRASVSDRGGLGGQGGSGDRGGSLGDRGGAGQAGGGARAGTMDRGGSSQLGGSGSRGGAFEGVDRGGSSARSASQRGSSSRSSFSGGGGGGRAGGGGGGGGRGGGGGGGGGRRR
jgi:Protein of unknown function (DUF3300)